MDPLEDNLKADLRDIAESMQELASHVEELAKSTESCVEVCNTLESAGNELHGQLARVAEHVEEFMMEGQAAMTLHGAFLDSMPPIMEAGQQVQNLRGDALESLAQWESALETSIGDLRSCLMQAPPEQVNSSDALRLIDEFYDRMRLCAVNGAIAAHHGHMGGFETAQAALAPDTEVSHQTKSSDSKDSYIKGKGDRAFRMFIDEVKALGEELRDLSHPLLGEQAAPVPRNRQAPDRRGEDALRRIGQVITGLRSSREQIKEAPAPLGAQGNLGRGSLFDQEEGATPWRDHMQMMLRVGEQLRIVQGYMRSSLQSHQEALRDLFETAQFVQGTLVHLHRSHEQQAKLLKNLAKDSEAPEAPDQMAPKSDKPERSSVKPMVKDWVETIAETTSQGR